MSKVKRIQVRESAGMDIAEMRSAGQTYKELLAEYDYRTEEIRIRRRRKIIEMP
ncbi:MAG: hypothetical protein JXA44_11990 [Methanospirillaceae archaeon]|nr:hypothetical protein [Methanospirillaceae archaeon]